MLHALVVHSYALYVPTIHFHTPPEKKLEGAHHLASPGPRFKSPPPSLSSSSSTISELDLIVREIIGADIFDGHHQDMTEIQSAQQQDNQSMKQSPDVAGSPNKKTRQHSPTRRSPRALPLHWTISFSILAITQPLPLAIPVDVKKRIWIGKRSCGRVLLFLVIAVLLLHSW